MILFLERSKVSYAFYNTVGFDLTSTNGVYQSTKELFTSPHLRRQKSNWFILTWMTLGIIYTLAISSLLGGAAGYIVPTQTWWQMPDGSLVLNLTEATQACWTLNNGSRLGLPEYNDGSIISGPLWQPFAATYGTTNNVAFCKQNWKDSNSGPSQSSNTGYPLFDDITRCTALLNYPLI